MMAGRKKNCSRTERSLSELPDDIIHRIFSYVNLSNQDAIQLSRLSKQLRRVLQKLPTLVFDSHLIPRGRSRPVYVRRYREELSYILSTLDRYRRDNVRLESFTLIAVDWMYVPLTLDQEDIYKRCIELAAKKGLRNLNLELETDFVLPESVFEVESLEELNLHHCCLRPSGTVAWPNLKRLRISDGTRVPDEKAFENIISGCPSIEYLEVNSRGFADFNVMKLFDLPNLKQLEFVLRLNQRLEMDATPNLESIRCSSSSSDDVPYHDRYYLGFGNKEYPSLRSMEITRGELEEHIFINFERRFPMVERLCLFRTLRRIDISSASLKEIKLIDNMKLQEACFDVPNLDHFEYENYNHIPKLTFGDNSRRWSSCIKLKVYLNKINATWFLGLNEFLSALNMSETSVTVQFQGVFSDEAHSCTADPVIFVPEIREFSVETNRSEISSSFVGAFLDGVFSICQPQTLKFMDCTKDLHEKLARSDHHYREVTDYEMPEKKKTIRIFQLENYCRSF